jgi:hypothetical protein
MAYAWWETRSVIQAALAPLVDRVFVVMQFGNANLDEVYRQVIKPAVEWYGYNSLRVDEPAPPGVHIAGALAGALAYPVLPLVAQLPLRIQPAGFPGEHLVFVANGLVWAAGILALRRWWLRRKPRAAVLIAAGIVLGLLSSPAHAQQCEPAGAVVEVRPIVAGADTLTVSYTLVNNTCSSLFWMSIGSGGPERTQLVPQRTPVVTSAPPGWLGTVVYPEETSYMHLWWEAKDVAAALPPGAVTSGFVARVAGPGTVLPGLRGMDGRLVRRIDFGSLPFTVGSTGVQCWWGWVR